jgi:hypothetical protein
MAEEPAGESEAPPSGKQYAEEYHPQFKAETKEVPGLLIYGPEASGCVKFEPDGLRITLPAGYPRQRSGTGVVTEFGIKGDFEITARFEILEEPRVGAGGNPTDLSLVVVPNELPEPDVWYKASQNRALLARELTGANQTGRFHADATTWTLDIPTDQWGNELFSRVELHHSERSLTTARTGRLRLVRSGSVLFFSTSEDAAEEFSLLHKHEFGTRDLKNVRILASTGGPAASLDVRVTDIRIRADGFVKPTEAIPQPTAGAGGGWSWGGILLAVAVPVVIALGTWWYRRRGRAAPAEQPAGAADSPAIVFECPGCKKRLKVKSERAGSRVKCPSCGKPVEVPASPPANPEQSP